MGPYENLGIIKEGGMGIIYKARDPILGRTVALKMIKGTGPAKRTVLERFQGEAGAVAKVKHDNIVKILEFGQIEGKPYFTMEVAERGSLLDHLSRFQKDPRASVSLVARVARAIHHVHSHGIVHRDLKPGNILLEENDKPVVSDFGLAKALEGETDLTHPGEAPGTPAYMAPEQVARRKLGPCTDIWALGVILFELLTGQRPFRDQGAIAASDPPGPRLLNPCLHPDLETIILKCLNKAPANRYSSASSLAVDLEKALAADRIEALIGSRKRNVAPMRTGNRWPRRRAMLLVLAGLAAVGLVIGAINLSALPPHGEEQGNNAATNKGLVGTPAAGSKENDDADLADKARKILEANCRRCHGEGNGENGFSFVLDRSQLVSEQLIVPGNPEKSPLLRRITSKAQPMPPKREKVRPSEADIAVLRDWIKRGAPDFGSRIMELERELAELRAKLKSKSKKDGK